MASGLEADEACGIVRVPGENAAEEGFLLFHREDLVRTAMPEIDRDAGLERRAPEERIVPMGAKEEQASELRHYRLVGRQRPADSAAHRAARHEHLCAR